MFHGDGDGVGDTLLRAGNRLLEYRDEPSQPSPLVIISYYLVNKKKAANGQARKHDPKSCYTEIPEIDRHTDR